MAEKFEVFDDLRLQQIIMKELTEIHSPFQFSEKAPGSCRWTIPSSQRYWTDSTFIVKMTFQVFKSVGGKKEKIVPGTDLVATTNAFLSSAFSNCSISLNSVLVETYSNKLYPYAAYVKQLMSYPQDYKKEILSTENGWYMDTGEDWNETSNLNKGWEARSIMIKDSGVVTLRGALPTDLSSCKTAITPGVSIDVTLEHSDDVFKLHAKNPDGASYFVEFSSIDLVLKRYILSPSANTHISSKIQAGSVSKYHLSRLSVGGPFQVRTGSSQHRQLLTLSRCPHTCIVFLTRMDTDINYSKNPFNVSNFDLSRVRLVYEGRELPENIEDSQLDLDTSSPGKKVTGIQWFSNFHELCGNLGNVGVSYGDFANGACFLVIKLQADQPERNVESPYATGRLEVWLDFKQQTTEDFYLRVIGLHTDTLSIDKNGSVSLSYLPSNF